MIKRLELEFPEAIKSGKISQRTLLEYLILKYKQNDINEVKHILNYIEVNIYKGENQAIASLWENFLLKIQNDHYYSDKLYDFLGDESKRRWHMLIEYKQVSEEIFDYIAREIPELDLDDDDKDIPYMLASDVARYIIKCFESGKNTEVKRWLEYVEWICCHENHKVSELGVIGYLEDMQNEITMNNHEFISMLGKKSTIFWKELIEYWKNLNDCGEKN